MNLGHKTKAWTRRQALWLIKWIVEQINQLVGEQPGEIVSPVQAVKAMIINGLGARISTVIFICQVF